MAIGEVLFLLWGIRVCLGVRNAESLYNEAKLISYAIYNIAFVNMLMVAIQWVHFLAIFHQFMPHYKRSISFNIYVYIRFHPPMNWLTLSDRAKPQIHSNLLPFHLLPYFVYVTTSSSPRTVTKILSELTIINREGMLRRNLFKVAKSLSSFFLFSRICES